MSLDRNQLTRWLELSTSAQLWVAEVLAHNTDGTSRLRLPGGREILAMGQDVAIGQQGYVRDGRVEGQAVSLPLISIEV